MIVVITAPTVEPLTLVEAKLHLKLLTSAVDVAHPDDTAITGLISAARDFAEKFCSRSWAAATYEARGSDFDLLLLPPVTALTTVKYIDSDGVEQTLSSTVYEQTGDSDAPMLRLKINQSWPAIYGQDDAVRVRFTAGVAPANVPYLVKAAMLLMIGSLYENRQDVSDKQTFHMPRAAESLLFPYRLSLGV